jgi:CHAD domain-containing protein
VVPDLGETEVREDHSVGDASLAVVRRQLQTWLQHEAGTRLGEDIEELHDMRVAIRRMREAIRLFRPFLPEPVLGFRNDLKWLGRILGEVRDLDVQIEQLVAWKGTLPIADASALEALHTRLEERRRESRIRMLDGLDSPRYDDLVTRMATALREPEIPTMAREVPVQVVAPSLLTRAHARILRDGRKIGPESPPQRYHDLRIRCKQLRYALEFHHPLYEAEATLVIRRLVQLQNLLGRHQDADVAVHWLREEALGERGSLPLSTSFVVGRLVERYTTEAARLREGFPEAFAQLSGKRWKRLQSAMASGYEQGLTRAFRTGPRLELL